MDNIKYYSKLGQDQYYIENISRFKTGGFFLDIGANDGLTESNTATLEFQLGWRGICIEANPHLIETLSNNRPNSIVVNNATWNTESELDFELTKPPVLSRVANIHRNNGLFKEYFDKESTVIKVKARTVSDILKDLHLFPYSIDYASIDVEGVELETLQGIDFTSIDIKFLTVEFRKPYFNETKEYMESVGYKLHRINVWDAEFYK